MNGRDSGAASGPAHLTFEKFGKMPDPCEPDSAPFLRERVLALPLWQWMILFCIVGLLLRGPVISNYGLTTDDGTTLAVTKLPVPELIANRLSKGHLPFFFVAFKGWAELVGRTNLHLLRLPSVLLTLAAIPVVAFLCAQVRDKWAAFLSMAIVVAHATPLRHAAELRMYSLMMILGGVLAGLVCSYLRKPTALKLTAASLLHVGLLTLHGSAIFFSVACFIIAPLCLPSLGEKRDRVRMVLVAGVLPMIASLVLWIHVLRSVDGGEVEKFEKIDAVTVLMKTLQELMCGIGKSGGLAKNLRTGVFFPAALLAVTGLASLRPVGDSPAPSPLRYGFFLLTCAYGAPLLAAMLSLMGAKVVGYPRYYIAGTLPLLALVGLGLSSAFRLIGQIVQKGSPGAGWIGATWRIVVVALLGLLTVSPVNHAMMATRSTFDQKEKRFTRFGDKLLKKVPKGSCLLIADHGAMRAILEIYIADKKEQFQFLEVNRDWEREEIQEYLKANMPPDADLYALYQGRLKPGFFESLKAVYTRTPHVSDDVVDDIHLKHFSLHRDTAPSAR